MCVSPNPGWMSLSEITTHWRVSRWTLTRAIDAGKLSARKTAARGRGGQWLVSSRAVARWLVTEHAYIGGRRTNSMRGDSLNLADLTPIDDIAEQLRTDVRRIKRAVNRHGCAYLRVGKEWWFTPQQLSAFLMAHLNDGVKSTASAAVDEQLAATKARVAKRFARTAA